MTESSTKCGKFLIANGNLRVNIMQLITRSSRVFVNWVISCKWICHSKRWFTRTHRELSHSFIYCTNALSWFKTSWWTKNLKHTVSNNLKLTVHFRIWIIWNAHFCCVRVDGLYLLYYVCFACQFRKRVNNSKTLSVERWGVITWLMLQRIS